MGRFISYGSNFKRNIGDASNQKVLLNATGNVKGHNRVHLTASLVKHKTGPILIS